MVPPTDFVYAKQFARNSQDLWIGFPD